MRVDDVASNTFLALASEAGERARRRHRRAPSEATQVRGGVWQILPSTSQSAIQLDKRGLKMRVDDVVSNTLHALRRG